MNPFSLLRVRTLVAVFMMIAFAMPAFGAGRDSSGEWPSYGNDPGGQRYSPLDQINRDNVAQLKVAWTYHTGDVSNGWPQSAALGFTDRRLDGSIAPRLRRRER